MKLPEFSEKTDEILCAVGSVLGISGAIAIASTLDAHTQLIAYAVVLISSVVTILWSMSVRNKWFLAMEFVYFALAIIGIYTRYVAITG
jgi:hypothetical protein